MSSELNLDALDISTLSEQSRSTLEEQAEAIGVENPEQSNKAELYEALLAKRAAEDGDQFGSGVIEVLDEGFGLLRQQDESYTESDDDIYMSQSQIKRFNLKTGDYVAGRIRPPENNERFRAMLRVEMINGDDPELNQKQEDFDDLTPLYPQEKFELETSPDNTSMRIVDLFTPIGKGQRGLIVSPPRAGKTILLQQIANSIHENHPECYIIILLIDERPEEVTDMRRNVGAAEVVASTFDETAYRHTDVAEMVLQRARRLVEQKEDVVILLDSITRLARAYNLTTPNSGKTLSGGVDSNALHKPKRFFGSARNIEGGGSLSIMATALIETGSRMDDVIFEEFKGTGNMEVNLDRDLANQRLYPAIDLNKSGTRKEELLLDDETLDKLYRLRKAMGTLQPEESLELVLEKMQESESNKEFLKQIKDAD